MRNARLLGLFLLSTTLYASSAAGWQTPEHPNSRNFCEACGDFSQPAGAYDATKYVTNSAFGDHAYPLFYNVLGTRFQYTPFQWMNSNGGQVRLENGIGQRVLVRWELSLLSGFRLIFGGDVHMTFLLINEATGAITPLVVLARRYQVLELSDPFRDDNGNYFDEIWDEEYVGVGGGIGGLAFTTFSSLSVSGSSGTVSIGPDYLNPEAEATGH